MKFTTITKTLMLALLLVLCINQTGAAQASIQPKADEIRGVWMSSSSFDSDTDKGLAGIRKMLDTLDSIGINNLYCFSILKCQHNKDYDFLQVLIDEAHSRNMKVHAICCPDNMFPEWQEQLDEHPEWIMKNMNEDNIWLNFPAEGAKELALSKITEALEYDVDGIQLDGIRYQTHQGYSYDDVTLKEFKDEFGKDPMELRWLNSGSVIWCEWCRWNADRVTSYVRDVKATIKKSGKDIPLSVAVFPDHESAKLLIGQDWQAWVDEGIVDMICPMLYTKNPNVFRKYTQAAMDVGKGKCLVTAGIQIKGHSHSTPDEVVEQVAISREENADGIVFFFATHITDEFLEALRESVFKE